MCKILSINGIYFIKGSVSNDDVHLMKKIESSEFKDVIIDMSECDGICSLGLGALVLLHNKLKKDSRNLVLINLQKSIRDIFSSSKLDTLFSIH